MNGSKMEMRAKAAIYSSAAGEISGDARQLIRSKACRKLFYINSEEKIPKSV